MGFSTHPTPVPIWDPTTLLKIINTDSGYNTITCLGYAPSQGRRCRNAIRANNRSEITALLQEISMTNPQSSGVKAKFSTVATLGLCVRFHQGQAESLVDKWMGVVEGLGRKGRVGGRARERRYVEEFEEEDEEEDASCGNYDEESTFNHGHHYCSEREIERKIDKLMEQLREIKRERNQHFNGTKFKVETMDKDEFYSNNTSFWQEEVRAREMKAEQRRRVEKENGARDERRRKEEEKENRARDERRRKEEEEEDRARDERRRKEEEQEQQRMEKERQEKLKEEAERQRKEEKRQQDEKAEHAERIRQKAQKRRDVKVREANERMKKEREEWDQSWEVYQTKWQTFRSCSSTKDLRSSIPWPVKSGLYKDVNQIKVKQFMTTAGPRNVRLLWLMKHKELLKWHPDKVNWWPRSTELSDEDRVTIAMVCLVVTDLINEAGRA